MSKRNMKTLYIMKSWVRILSAILASFMLVLIFSHIFPINEVQKEASLETFTNHLDKRIPEIMKAYDIPGANIALVDQGKIVWTGAYGYADLETGRKIKADDILRVQSISKSVTAWGVMELVDQQKIDLDTPIKQYFKNWEFPDTAFSDDKITVRQLLCHKAGMPLGDFYNFFSPEEKIPTLKQSLTNEVQLIQEPGASFSYSNVGYNLLELMVEEVTGREFSDYMEQEILKPIGMVHASFEWNKEIESSIPNGYNLTGQPVPPYIYPEKASGGLFATAEDIAAFVAAGMPEFWKENQILSDQSVKSLYTPMARDLGFYSLVFDSYGFGHYLEDLPNGMQAVSHGGQGTGWMTHFHAVPELGDGIVILTNSQRSWPFISYILSDWAQWSGFSVGMSMIVWGQYALWILIGVMWVIFFYWLWQLAERLFSKSLRFAPLKKKRRFRRLLMACSSLVMFAGLLWAVSQDYLFISSVFPIASVWLGISVIALAIVMLLLALFPAPEKEPVSKNSM